MGVEFGREWGPSTGWKSMSCPSTTDLNKLLKTSREYHELAHVWRAWRDNTGRKLKPHYSRLVTLANKAARLNGKSSYTSR